MLTFTEADGPALAKRGLKMAKRRNPVYLERQTQPFEVHDPISGHVWPVAADDVDVHYEEF